MKRKLKKNKKKEEGKNIPPPHTKINYNLQFESLRCISFDRIIKHTFFVVVVDDPLEFLEKIFAKI